MKNLKRTRYPLNDRWDVTQSLLPFLLLLHNRCCCSSCCYTIPVLSHNPCSCYTIPVLVTQSLFLFLFLLHNPCSSSCSCYTIPVPLPMSCVLFLFRTDLKCWIRIRNESIMRNRNTDSRRLLAYLAVQGR
jgi:hypothetical protein